MARLVLARDLAALAARDRDVARELRRIGLPERRHRPPGFATLLRIILGQQVSVQAAAAMWRRLEDLLGGEVAPATLAARSDADLRACGFSRQKTTYARALAAALDGGALDLARIHRLRDADAIDALTTVKGIGVWSAEIYLLFALGRGDAFPAGDLALRVGFQRLKRLDEAPTPAALRTLTEGWRPYRGAAAHFLWHSYANPPLG
ncbi:MAG: DNA-3-methyladenine glycosylase family protein [Rhodospirillales bacterium]|jgi:DNA-3-methyladenine glycosylase II